MDPADRRVVDVASAGLGAPLNGLDRTPDGEELTVTEGTLVRAALVLHGERCFVNEKSEGVDITVSEFVSERV